MKFTRSARLFTRSLCMASVLFINHSHAEPNRLLGSWARNAVECTRPELIFNPSAATIQIDADGKPISFDYEKITYSANGNNISANLKKDHPYSKTKSKTSLQFVITSHDHAALQFKKGRAADFVRCEKSADK